MKNTSLVPATRKFQINFSFKMGGASQPSVKKNFSTVQEAKEFALKECKGDTYTVSILDFKNKRVYHYGYTGIAIGTNKF